MTTRVPLWAPQARPGDDEVEVTVLGAGNGESIVVHARNDDWVIIDSYRCPETGTPAALQHLDSLSVDVASVAAVVCTHWDSDHALGLGEILEHCRFARFFCSDALIQDAFLSLVQYWHPHWKVQGRPRSKLAEFAHVLAVLKAEKYWRGPFGVKQSMRLQTASGERELPLRVLAPSLRASTLSSEAFRTADRAIDPSTRAFGVIRPNAGSVVLWLDLDGRAALLPGDLENETHVQLGWNPVLTQMQTESKRAQVYKVSHHGSHRSHDERVWQHVLERNPHAAVSSLAKGRNALPTPASRERIKTLTQRGYIVGLSRRLPMSFRSVNHRYQAERKSAGRQGLRRRGDRPGRIMYRGPSGALRVGDWVVATEGNASCL